jgi:flavodoxin
MRINIIYWSGIGNTKATAKLIAEGATVQGFPSGAIMGGEQ